MEELKQAYQLLEVPEDANQEEIEERYFLLLRRHKSRIKDQNSTFVAEEEQKFEQITKAYQQIKAHLQQKSLEENPIYQAEQKKSPFRRKLEHFLTYYRWHLIFSLIGIALIGSFLYSTLTKEPEIPADVSTMMVGAYHAEDFKPIEARMTELVPEWERVAVIPNMTPGGETADPMYDMALLQKSIAILASERPEIYIVDEWQFERLGEMSAFLPLDEYEDLLLQKVSEDRLLYAEFPEIEGRRLYGVDLTDSPVFAEILLDRQAKIFTIRNDQEDTSKAWQLIEALIDHLPE